MVLCARDGGRVVFMSGRVAFGSGRFVGLRVGLRVVGFAVFSGWRVCNCGCDVFVFVVFVGEDGGVGEKNGQQGGEQDLLLHLLHHLSHDE